MVTAVDLFTDHRHGDLAPRSDPEALARTRASIAPGPWTWLDQVHGAEVVVVTRPGQWAGAAADAAVTAEPGAVLSVQTADCAPVLLAGDGTMGVVHAGWRGLLAGVIEATAQAMVVLGGAPRTATLGPCIRSRCYEFGVDDLDLLADRYGPRVRGRTMVGEPSLDVAAAVAVACKGIEVDLTDVGTCTACSSTHWSHRARADRGRQALVAWLAER